MTSENYREKIDLIDAEIIKLFSDRMEIAKSIANYKKENAQLEMDFFIRDAENLIPIEVKAKNGATKSLNALIDNNKYSDIRFGIKLCSQNIGYNEKFYTIPYFCTFLLKRWLTERK